VTPKSTQIAATATKASQPTAVCPNGRTIAEAMMGPSADPVFPPTWNADWAVPKRPPDAIRATRDASGWKVADPTPITADARISAG
jgi:hypothetical protein